MKKQQIENSKKSEISEKLFRVFLFPSFRFCPVAKIENSDLKISEKNFRVFDLVVQIPLRISSVTSKNIYINNNYTLISANFEAFRCGTYLRAAFKRGRCLCQRKKNYANDTLKLSHCIFPNNNEQLLLCFIFSHIPELLASFIVSLLAYLLHMHFTLVAVRSCSGF